MTESLGEEAFIAGVSFCCIGFLAHFFASRRELFIGVFSLGRFRTDLDHLIPAQPMFQRGMRIIAHAQLAMGTLFVVMGIVVSLAS